MTYCKCSVRLCLSKALNLCACGCGVMTDVTHNIFLHICVVLNCGNVICFPCCFCGSTYQVLGDCSLHQISMMSLNLQCDYCSLTKQMLSSLSTQHWIMEHCLSRWFIAQIFPDAHSNIDIHTEDSKATPYTFLSRSLAACHVMNKLSAKKVWHEQRRSVVVLILQGGL